MTSRTPFFNAHSINIGTCKDPACRSVHVHLLDEQDHPHAQFVMDCEHIEDVIADLRAVRDRLVMGGDRKGLGN